MVVARKRVPVDMGSTAHPYAGQRQEQILKEIQAEAIALCRFYGKSPEEMTDTFKLFKSKNSPREAPEAVPKLGKLLPPVFHRPEQTFFPHAPTLVGASGLGQGPGNYCHQEIGGTAERRVFDDDVCSMPPSRGSQATVRSKQSNGFARAESALTFDCHVAPQEAGFRHRLPCCDKRFKKRYCGKFPDYLPLK